jgi:hypothetical protein
MEFRGDVIVIAGRSLIDERADDGWRSDDRMDVKDIVILDREPSVEGMLVLDFGDVCTWPGKFKGRQIQFPTVNFKGELGKCDAH